MCGTMCNCNYSHRHLKSMLIVYKNVLSLSLARSLSPFSLTLPERCSHLSSSLVFSHSPSLNCPQHQTETVKPNWLLWGNCCITFLVSPPSCSCRPAGISASWHLVSVTPNKPGSTPPTIHLRCLSLLPSLSLSLSLSVYLVIYSSLSAWTCPACSLDISAAGFVSENARVSEKRQKEKQKDRR